MCHKGVCYAVKAISLDIDFESVINLTFLKTYEYKFALFLAKINAEMKKMYLWCTFILL